MKFKFWQPDGSGELEAPDKDAEQVLEELRLKPPEEVEGHPLELLYYTTKVLQLIQSGEQTEARLLLQQTVKRFPQDVSARHFSSRLYLMLGDEDEAAIQIGVAVALDPAFYPAHLQFAYLLLRRGEKEASDRLLEIGWSYHQKSVPKKEQAEQRERFFALPARQLAAYEERVREGTSPVG